MILLNQRVIIPKNIMGSNTDYKNFILLLETLGLKGKEMDIYILCFNNGPLSATSIAKQIGVHRVSAYQIINKLTEKGFIYPEKNLRDSGRQLFTAASQEQLSEILLKQKEQINFIEKKLANLLVPKNQHLESDLFTFRSFNNIFSLKQMLKEALRPKEEIKLISSVDSPLNIYEQRFLNFFLKEIIKNRIGLKVITFKDDSKINNKTKIWEHKKVEIKTIDRKHYPFGSGMLITSKLLFLFSWNKQSPGGIAIADSAIKQTYHLLFNLLWNNIAMREKSQSEKSFANEMILIPGGIFLQGDGINSRKIFIDSFLIDETPVTNREYLKFIKDTGYPAPANWKNSQYPKNKGNYPVINVSFHDAKNYASWASKRLPTEEEWEKAARGTDGRIYPWGNNFNLKFCNILRIKRGTTPVKKYPLGKSYYGVHDMAGNVWEWTNTSFDEKSEKYVLKGGSWGNNETTSQCAYRTFEYANKYYDNIGFRCVKDVI